MSDVFDIAVVGSGAAGIAAAVTAARFGCRTLLLDKAVAGGGTGGFSGLTTICGLYDDRGGMLNDGFSAEFADAIAGGERFQMGKVWVLPYAPERFREVVNGLIDATPHLTAHWNAPVGDVVLDDGRITSIHGYAVNAVIDCSGHAEVARQINHPCLETDGSTQAPAVVFRLEKVDRKLATMEDAVQVLLQTTRAGFPPITFQRESVPGVLTAKFSSQPEEVVELIQFLRESVSGFERCDCPATEFVQSRRDGRMIVGRETLSGDDVLSGARFENAVAKCAWPIEQWSADGLCHCRYLPEGSYYEIPAGALRAAKVDNLFMAGKTISADVDAIGSARVMGCCLATGQAAAGLASEFLQLCE